MYKVGCQGKRSTINPPLDNNNSGGAGGYGFYPGGRGGDGDKPPILNFYGVGGFGGGGATGIGRSQDQPLFIAPGGGGGGGGKFYIAPGSQNIQSFNEEEYRRTVFRPYTGSGTTTPFYSRDTGEVTQSQDGILTITPIYTDLAPPVITPFVTQPEPNGNNGWYRTNVTVSWVVSSDSPITSQTGCTNSFVTTDTSGFTSNCSVTNSVGTTSGSAPTVKRDATLPNITATARDQNGVIFTFGGATNVPVTVTYTCSDATSGVASCPEPQTFSSTVTVTGTVVDNAGNSRTVTFGTINSTNQPPTISAIDNVETPINTSVTTAPFNVGDAETSVTQLTFRFRSSNENIVDSLSGISIRYSNPNDLSQRVLDIVPQSNKVGTTIITVEVYDNSGARATTTFTVSVRCGTITISQPDPVNYGGSLNWDLSPFGGVAPYHFVQTSGVLPGNVEFDYESNRLVGNPVRALAPDARQLGFTVSDANGCSNPVTVNLNIACLTNPVVTQFDDTHIQSLRGMVEGACLNSTITFAGFLQNQELEFFGAIQIFKPLTIEGLGADKLALKNIKPPSDNSNVINVRSTGGEVTISGLTIKDGNARNDSGGGIRSSSNLTVRDSVITNNSALEGGGIWLGSSEKTLTLINTTVSNNTATSFSSFNGGGIVSNGAVNIVNSTVSGNTLNTGFNGAAGIYAVRGLITNSTITNNRVNNVANSTNTASGIYGGSANLVVRSSIIAANQNNASLPDVVNLFTSSGFNLIGNRGSVTAFNQPTDQTGTSGSLLNPGLNMLAMFGGTTPTHSLVLGSPAMDRGFAFGSTTDQRGVSRPVDFPNFPNAAGGDGSDIGAFEFQFPTAVSVAITGRVRTEDGRGLVNAFVHLTDGAGNVRSVRTSSFGYFVFEDVEVGQAYILSLASKRYVMQPLLLNLDDEVTGLELIAEPRQP